MPEYPSILRNVALTAEERKESTQITHQYHSQLKWAWNKAGLSAFPLSFITTHLIYKYVKNN